MVFENHKLPCLIAQILWSRAYAPPWKSTLFNRITLAHHLTSRPCLTRLVCKLLDTAEVGMTSEGDHEIQFNPEGYSM
jgi:hypothetical protein